MSPLRFRSNFVAFAVDSVSDSSIVCAPVFRLLIILVLLFRLIKTEAAGNDGDDDLLDRRERSLRFPEDAKQPETNAGTNPWRFQVDTNQVPNTRQSKSPVFPGQGESISSANEDLFNVCH